MLCPGSEFKRKDERRNHGGRAISVEEPLKLTIYLSLLLPLRQMVPHPDPRLSVSSASTRDHQLPDQVSLTRILYQVFDDD